MSTESDLKRAQAGLQKELTKIVRGGAISTFNAIIQESPVDIGTFRGNWQASVNDPKLNTIDIDAAKNRVEDTATTTNGYALDGALFLTNNLPYAAALENGHSKAKGSGWVAKIVNQAKVKLQSNINELLS